MTNMQKQNRYIGEIEVNGTAYAQTFPKRRETAILTEWHRRHPANDIRNYWHQKRRFDALVSFF
jgi:hypothetical protein